MNTMIIDSRPETIVLKERLRSTNNTTGKIYIGNVVKKERIDCKDTYTMEDGMIVKETKDTWLSNMM